MAENFRFGIEEEFFLASANTRRTPDRGALSEFHKAAHDSLPDAERELLQCQVEIASPPTENVAQARGWLQSSRARLAKLARDNDMLLLASGTHPLAEWSAQHQTEKDRYRAVTDETQMIARRNVVCGMHVHVEVPDQKRRIELMNRLLPCLPLLFALSTSSPFWQGRDTGLASYRLSVWGELPRTGIPDIFVDTEAYDRYVATMVSAGAIKDASFLWWAIRPSMRYPTLELRVADSCTSLEDALAIAALYRCLVRHAVNATSFNAGMDGSSRAIVGENLWRAQRAGVKANFIDGDREIAVPCAEYLTRLVDDVLGADISALGCEGEVGHAMEIVRKGTSADHQRDAVGQGSLESAVDWIAAATAS